MNKQLNNFKSEPTGASVKILQRTAQADKTAIKDCVDAYGNLVWALARKFTNSSEEAEKAVLKIFNEIWRCAERYDSAKCSEQEYVIQTAYRQLVKQPGKSCH